MIRAASLRGFVPLVEELGGDPDELLREFGMSRETVASDDQLVSITAHDRMLDVAATTLRCPDLGLRLATMQDVSILGPLALAVESSATASQAVELASRFLFVHSPALSISVQPDPYGRRGVVAITYRKDLRESSYSPQATELGLGLLFQIAELLVGDRAGFRSVELSHAPISPVRRYTDFFGVDVKFGRPVAALRVERRVLDRRFAEANETIRQLAVQFLADRFPDPLTSTSQRVRLVLAETLITGPTLAHVASLLAMHPRTLQRHLAGEGLTFESLLDDVRRDAATRMITTTDLPLGAVALSVGFGEQSTLSHAVRRWCGTSPRQLRGGSTKLSR
jgi:AraC-like DNA-binding protein